ncbi:hypothetical protein CGRA01v4_00855 [Colletotrichum graminicola]|nr:hypothetical protein CGRA01v4_00855 [Colletotrichum graminicola]
MNRGITKSQTSPCPPETPSCQARAKGEGGREGALDI